MGELLHIAELYYQSELPVPKIFKDKYRDKEVINNALVMLDTLEAEIKFALLSRNLQQLDTLIKQCELTLTFINSNKVKLSYRYEDIISWYNYLESLFLSHWKHQGKRALSTLQEHRPHSVFPEQDAIALIVPHSHLDSPLQTNSTEAEPAPSDRASLIKEIFNVRAESDSLHIMSPISFVQKLSARVKKLQNVLNSMLNEFSTQEINELHNVLRFVQQAIEDYYELPFE